MNEDPIVIIGCARTPIGAFQGELSSLSAPKLGAISIEAAVNRAEVNPKDIDQVLMGCVLPAGLGQAPARQASLGAGLTLDTGCVTVNKMCGSGMQAITFAYDMLKTGDYNIIVAGGMESMSNAPYLLPKARSGFRMGHHQVLDHMFCDGLEDAFESGTLMGVYAEKTATAYRFSREQQDAFAINSLTKAKNAIESGAFEAEIAKCTVINKKETKQLDTDETPLKAQEEKIPKLKPAFAKNGTVTAANSSSISDGASALVLTRLSHAQQLGVHPIAKIISHASQSQAPSEFPTAPIGAVKKLLRKINWDINDVDLFEINEAFAVVAMALMHDLSIPSEKVNIHGGACALGHPVGASGARILVTLIHALQHKKLKRGVAAICIGGGEAIAMAIEIC